MEGKKCPKCKILTRESKGSKYITELLSLNNVEFVKEVSMKNLGYEGERRLDFLVVDNNLPMFAIEFHGIQHYKKIRNSFFGGIEGHRSRVERDRIKKGQCWNSGIPLIEIPYTESEDEIRYTVEYFLNVYGLDKRRC
ncbi:DUF2726 domain-containing protein [Exiguobacterium sp. SH1S1]|uniref:DUF2726 domain-containing protein n=2 Tax=Exiguobacterium TaxID=33986 RepID=UPI00103E597C|nr:DUF2726 domain-containing protein [Exiguobacterium sp. SH1S1]TCI42989.1 DUF2726 domain-containing protein [Exiguobacterium sp. SH5S32]TCI67800.1 DUF2726 domain-containing protein [Exiguobacterium sp. SH1S1]